MTEEKQIVLFGVEMGDSKDLEDDSLDTLQTNIGGYVEYARLESEDCLTEIYFDEDGLNKNLSPNINTLLLIKIGFDFIGPLRGPFIIVQTKKK